MSITDIKAGTPSNKKKGRIEEGTYVARITQLIDLGTQESDYEGLVKNRHEIMVTFEFPTETINIKGEEKPRWLSKNYTVSSHEKAAILTLMSSADPEGKHTNGGRNLTGLLGLPLMVSVGSTKTGNAKVQSVAKLMKGVSVAELSKPGVVFDLSSTDRTVFDTLPDWVQEKVRLSIDYHNTVFAKGLAATIDDSDVPY